MSLPQATEPGNCQGETWIHLWWQRPPVWSAQAVMTQHYRLCGLNNRIIFLTVLEAESSRYQPVWYLMESTFYSVSSCLQYVLTCRRGRASLWGLFVKGTYLIHEGSTLMTKSVQFSRSVMSDSLQPHEPQHARPSCPSPTSGVYPNSRPLSWWCHLTISSSVIPFSSYLQYFPTSGSFQMSQLFESGDQNTGVSASTSVLLINTQVWFPLG